MSLGNWQDWFSTGTSAPDPQPSTTGALKANAKKLQQQAAALQQQNALYQNIMNTVGTTNATYTYTTASSSTYPQSSSWSSGNIYGEQLSLSPAVEELLVSLGFVENLAEGRWELDLKTSIQIPIQKIAALPMPMAQKTITTYLEEMKNKIITKIKDTVLVNKLIDLEKLKKDIKKEEE